LTLQQYWDSLKRGDRTAFSKEVAKHLERDMDDRHRFKYMSFLARSGDKANPYIKTAIAIKKASNGVVDLDSWG
jgi:hypothetical protein|tara:strand:- start:24 stop:245 length:222 start_codon:yes stop_codon:yes gene_type:complete